MAVMVQIRNVPDEIAAELKSRAAAERLSLSDYLLRHLDEILEQSRHEEVLRRLAARPRRHLGVSAAELVAEAREEE